jgi:hypothetical protein
VRADPAAAQPLKSVPNGNGDVGDTSDEETAELQELLQQMHDPAVRCYRHAASMKFLRLPPMLCCIASRATCTPQLSRRTDMLLNPRRVELIIKLLGLQRAADTVVGNAMLRGVSGGERKRVTSAGACIPS